MKFRARLQDWFDRAVDLFPLTWLGVICSLGGLLGLLYYGWRRLDLVLLVIGAIAVGLAVMSLVLVLLGAVVVFVRVRTQKRGESISTECGVPSTTGFSLPSLWWLPMIDVKWTWLSPTAEVVVRTERGRHRELVTAERRGHYVEVVRRIEVGDAFGFARVAFRAKEERGLSFFPSMGSLKRIDVARSLASGEDRPHPGGQPEGERADLRRYAPGDPVRFILWKVFARTRDLIVRTPEQAISPSRQTIAYLVTGEADEPAAGTARVAIETGALGSGWCIGTDGYEQGAKDLKSAMDLLTCSSKPTEEGGSGLATFVRRHANVPGARVVVFVPARGGKWLDRVMEGARAAGGQGKGATVEFVVCADGFVETKKPGRIARFLGITPESDGEPHAAPLNETRELVAKLGAMRGNVLLVDRKKGRVFSGAQSLASLQAPKGRGR